MIVWRRDWINDFETPWSVFEKVCYANHVGRTDILKKLGDAEVKGIKSLVGDKRRELIKLSSFNPQQLEDILNYDLIGHNKKIISKLLLPINNFIERDVIWFPIKLQWCEQCIQFGYHSWLHQFALIHYCPSHQTKLLDSCPSCQNDIPFLLSDKRLGEPFTCTCGYRLANFEGRGWTDWKNSIELVDNSVINWLEQDVINDEQNTYLIFNTAAASVHLLNLAPIIYSKFRREETIDYQLYAKSNEYQYNIYKENEHCFRNIDRYIKSKILYKHRECVRILQELKKEEGENFPPICPFAYAYVFWKHTLLKNDRFYIEGRKEDSIKLRQYSGLKFVTGLIQDHIIDILNKISISNYFNKNLVHWTINRFTTEFCLNYFYQWLNIAKKHSEAITTPSWTEVLKMVENSLPKSLYKIQLDGSVNLTVELFALPNIIIIENLENVKCKLRTKHVRKSYRNMKSITPMMAAMRIFDNPSKENKLQRDYVEAYVSRLTI
ncbi:hypothetical protein ACFP56_00100 [Paenibacillus septentrionalis]|uniref:TniQ family protein n=1 Tax=Paenibacillus septentrionalis TaxID=429342 RepID=A0ABW1UZF9_9BACL